MQGRAWRSPGPRRPLGQAHTPALAVKLGQALVALGERGFTSFDLKYKEGGIGGASGLEGSWLSGDDPVHGPGEYFRLINQSRPNDNDMGHQLK